ncbi:MAG: hypothetical protein ACJZ8O_08680, partial [Pirellulaceae bacterium]
PTADTTDTDNSDLEDVAKGAAGKKGRRNKKDKKGKKEKPGATTPARVKPRPVTSNPLALHGEKIGLATALLLAIYLVYSGFSTETFDQQPEDLSTAASQADQKITTSSWDTAIQSDEKLQERVNTPDYVANVNNANQDTPAKSYETPKLFNPTKLPPNQNPRQDPDIYAPFDLRAIAMIAAIASKADEDVADPTEGDALALVEEKEEDGPRRRRPKKEENDDANAFGGGDGGGLFGGGDGGMGGAMGGSQSTENVKVLYDDRGQLIGYKVGGGGGGMGGGAMGGMGGMDGGGEGMGGAMGGMGGMDGGSGGGSGGGNGGGGGETAPAGGNAIAQAKALVAITALVPFKQQVEEYERVFLDRNGYNPSRDFPKYVFLIAQRVDVTNDPNRQVDEADWESLTSTAKHQKVNEKQWHGSPGEIVNAMYLDNYISLKAPPVLMRDLDAVLRHPEIPLSGTVSETVENEDEQDGASDEDTEELNPGDDLPGALLAGNGAADGGGAMGGMGGAMGGMGGGGAMGGMGGGGMGGDAMGGMGGGGMGGMGGGMGGMGGGMGGMGGGMGGMGGSESYNRGPVAENKLVRFYDMNAVPGRIYRYRVQVLIEDPNHPNSNPSLEFGAQKAPHPRTLSPEVKQRIANLAATDFYLFTDWSDATEPVTVPQLASVIAGSVEPEVRTRMTSGQYIPLGEPTANMKPTIFDTNRAVDMVVDRVVNRGSVLNFTSTAEYPHPIKLVVNKVDDINFSINMMVLDIRGGEPLPGHFDDDPFSAPGEFALLDANGNLVVQNELDDFDRFLRFDYDPDVKEDPLGADGGGMGGGMPGMGGEEGGGLFGN